MAEGGRLRIAVVGAGAMGARHLGKLADMPGVVLVGLVDPDPATARIAAEAGTQQYPTLDALMAAAGLDAVCVASPTPSHHEVVSACLDAGLHVLVEKPITATLQEADDLIDAAARRELVLAVGHVERHNPVVRRLRALIEDGTAGTVSSILARRVGGVPPREPVTDVIIDLAVHDIDVMGYLLAEPPTLIGAHGSCTFQQDRHDSAELLLRVGNASGFIQVNWVTPAKVRSLVVTGSHGVIEANYLTQELRLLETAWIEDSRDFSAFIEAFGHPRELAIPVPREEPLRVELEAFVHDIRHGAVKESVSASEARHALAVALEASAVLPS